MLTPGQTIGRYKLVRELGRGGMGVVFEAIHEELASRVAVKVVEPALAGQGTDAQRFLREARAAAQARHLHAVRVFDIGIHDGLSFIVMELLEGETLADLFIRETPLIAQRIAELFLPVLSAVEAAHEAGVVHRDLKPSNIMLARRGGRIVHPVVTDFGISKLLTEDGGDAMTGSHAVLGTLHYMAPELTRDARKATPASDQYSLGVMLYEAATGRRPFQGESPYDLMHAIVTGSCPRPRECNPAIDLELEAVVQRAMDRDPKKRYPTVRALGAALLSLGSARAWALWAPDFSAAEERGGTFAEGGGANDESSRSRRASEARWTRRRPLAAITSGVALLGAGVLLGLTFGSRAPVPVASPAMTSVSPVPLVAASPSAVAALPAASLGSAFPLPASEASPVHAAIAPSASAPDAPSGGSRRHLASLPQPARPASPRREIGSNNAPILK